MVNCSLKAVVGIIFGMLGAICYICGFAINEITRYNTANGASWCGWDGLGFCSGVNCEEEGIIDMGEDDHLRYADNGWADLCDLCPKNDCVACTNKVSTYLYK